MLRLALFIASLCTLIMFFAIAAKVAGGRYAERPGRMPISVCPDSRALSVPSWPVIVCILAVVDYTHGHSLNNIPGFQ